jgi:hypothetical protein
VSALLLGLSPSSTPAQELQQFFSAKQNDKEGAALITEENADRYKTLIKEGMNAGHLWQCGKNTFLFYDGWVFVGSQKNGKDLGVKPYNLVSNYFVSGPLIRFEFRGLPFENKFELNTANSTLFKREPMFHTAQTLNCSMLK